MTTFKDIVWKTHPLGESWAGSIDFKNHRLSVVAGPRMYCEPKLTLRNPSEYSSFEVAVLGPDGDFVTDQFFETEDQVIGWQSALDINRVISKIIETTEED